MLELNRIYCGDCLDVMKEMPENTIDSIVTDPPYGLKFMGKEWDHGVPGIPFWQEVMRISKPGAHMLAFGGTRTHHRCMVAIEDAGWEIRDMMMWVYGQGFPKSLNVSKAIDKMKGAEREIVGYEEKTPLSTQNGNDGWKRPSHYNEDGSPKTIVSITKPATPEAVQWDGWGSALKPAYEPIVLCRKPLEGTIVDNVLKWGVGGINIDRCRIGNEIRKYNINDLSAISGGNFVSGSIQRSKQQSKIGESLVIGRFPANFIHDGSQTVLDMFPDSGNGTYKKGGFRKKNTNALYQLGFNKYDGNQIAPDNYGDSGSAARFFYCAKVSKAERDIGCEGLPENDIVTFQTCNGTSGKPGSLSEGRETKYRNNHPTVKPIALLSYLCRLITPPKGVILDPFAGSGSTGLSAIKEGFNYILIEKSQEYVDIANARLKGVI